MSFHPKNLSKKPALFAGLLLVAALLSGSPAPVPRVVAIADIHGDFDAFQKILKHVRLAENGRWIGRDATLVQTGDFTDRGPKTRAVMDLLMALQKDAPRQGGKVIVLMGNHEAMNLYGDMRYVTPADYASFADAKSEKRRKAAYESVADLTGAAPASESDWMKDHPPGFIEHREAFSPSGKYGKWVRSLPAVARVNETIFLHGGIHPGFAGWTVDQLNEAIAREVKIFDSTRKYMVDQKIALPFHTFEEMLATARTAAAKQKDETLEAFLGLGSWLSINPDGPLWFRGFANWSTEEGGPEIDKLLKAFGVERFVVGHTPHAGRVVSRFGDKVYLIDTGMLASYFPGGIASALNIQDGKVSVIYSDQPPKIPYD